MAHLPSHTRQGILDHECCPINIDLWYLIVLRGTGTRHSAHARMCMCMSMHTSVHACWHMGMWASCGGVWGTCACVHMSEEAGRHACVCRGRRVCICTCMGGKLALCKQAGGRPGGCVGRWAGRRTGRQASKWAGLRVHGEAVGMYICASGGYIGAHAGVWVCEHASEQAGGCV